ncbi:hypothetical protein [Pontibacter silvestris]|uniref:hypothetical protein n=1 Tax=Pontibacter silvestris TaxID=2305183 RepID=UPI001E3F2CDB|nr:hypothetical protein [Pontibacter silvestris]MCC9138040.1 hypothetical protein [Pontibacter silvestris]
MQRLYNYLYVVFLEQLQFGKQLSYKVKLESTGTYMHWLRLDKSLTSAKAIVVD